MEILLVQPTDTSYHLNSALDQDFWEFVDGSDEYDTYATFARLDHFFCSYEIFDTFAKAEAYLDGMSATDAYKKRMHAGLNKLKDYAEAFGSVMI